LAKLDEDYLRADESGDKALKQMVAERKQILRDITDVPEIASASSVSELKAVWPVALGSKPVEIADPISISPSPIEEVVR